MSLVEFLMQNGFARIPLSRSGVGHFHTEGRLNGRPVAVLIDTGAASSVFSFDVAREMGLPLTKLPMYGGGAGAAKLEIHQIQEAQFVIGDITPKARALLTMDLSHVNQALALKGSSPIDAVLGVDVLEAHSAVIDYGSSSLYLKS
ncbi:MAG TPA: retropepsin-like aspartic protease [Pyrinomonadaceae bacterium]|jgi:clan AA aspartic protease (TIGR02281 family)|nr:retropepsin-like aspartic protease [Pyrinomonadaceae bacterium]